VTRHLREDITLWVASPDEFGGFTFSAPQALMGRWEERAELYIDSKGQEAVSKAVVFLSADVTVGDFLYHGESVAADPMQLAGAQQIKQFAKVPDLRNLKNTRMAYL